MHHVKNGGDLMSADRLVVSYKVRSTSLCIDESSVTKRSVVWIGISRAKRGQICYTLLQISNWRIKKVWYYVVVSDFANIVK